MSDNGERFANFNLEWHDLNDISIDNVLMELVQGFEFQEVFGAEFEPTYPEVQSEASSSSLGSTSGVNFNNEQLLLKSETETENAMPLTPSTSDNDLDANGPTDTGDSSVPSTENSVPSTESSVTSTESSIPSKPNSIPMPPEAVAGPSRFKKLDEADLKEIEDHRYSASTKKNTKWGLQMFQDWCISSIGHHVDTQTMTKDELSGLLRRFYAETQPKPSATRAGKFSSAELANEYHKNTLKSVRSAINRHFKDIGRDIDIVKDREFRDANDMLNAKLKLNLKKRLVNPYKAQSHHKQL